MKNNNYISLEIEFQNIAKIKNKLNSFQIHGKSFYIFDVSTQKIVHEYIQIINCNYRVTDNRMVKTYYYKIPRVKEFRNKFLIGFNNSNKTIYRNLNKKEISEINEYLINQKTTVRNMYSLFSGSNISGAESNHKASPMKCIDFKYFNCSFANVLSKYKNKKSTNIIVNHKGIKNYKLDDFIVENKRNEIIKNFTNYFYEYNEDLKIKWINDNGNENDRFDFSIKHDNKQFLLNETQNLFIDCILNDKEKFNLGKIKEKLRTFYTSNIYREINNKNIPLFSTTKPINSAITKNAHIIPFSELIQKFTLQSLKDAINPYNCLRIDGNTHDEFDRKIIKFDLKGNILERNNQIRMKEFLNVKNMPKETKEFLKRYINENESKK